MAEYDEITISRIIRCEKPRDISYSFNVRLRIKIVDHDLNLDALCKGLANGKMWLDGSKLFVKDDQIGKKLVVARVLEESFPF